MRPDYKVRLAKLDFYQWLGTKLDELHSWWVSLSQEEQITILSVSAMLSASIIEAFTKQARSQTSE